MEENYDYSDTYIEQLEIKVASYGIGQISDATVSVIGVTEDYNGSELDRKVVTSVELPVSWVSQYCDGTVSHDELIAVVNATSSIPSYQQQWKAADITLKLVRDGHEEYLDQAMALFSFLGSDLNRLCWFRRNKELRAETREVLGCKGHEKGQRDFSTMELTHWHNGIERAVAILVGDNPDRLTPPELTTQLREFASRMLADNAQVWNLCKQSIEPYRP